MFRWRNSLDVITLFHKPGTPSSMRALAILKQASATASETATVDQAGDHSKQNKIQRSEFELNITEEPPTPDQLRSILEYVGSRRAKDVVEGANDLNEAMKALKTDGRKFKYPVIVDWNNGKAVIGDSESEILKMLSTLPKAS